jgi:prepilin-type N-terminal cleavage/methylation domain-containing protein
MFAKIKKKFRLLFLSRRSAKGFTLVELLIYISIFAVFSVVTVDAFTTIAKGNAASGTALEVQQNLRYSMERITQVIHSATAVNSTSASTLSLAMADVALNPTIFSLNSGVLNIQEGADPIQALTTNKVVVDALNFFEISNGSPAKSTVETNLTISYNNQGNTDYQFSASSRTTASLRQ